MDELPETAEFLTFVRTVEARSISRAARELGVPRPTVGRRLARLEEKLGVRLLRRTTRTMVLTDAGEALYQRARGVIAAVREAEQSVRRSDDAVRGTLRVSAPPMNLVHFGAMISDFIGRYPDVRLELDLTTRHVDLAAGSYDVAIRAAAQLPPGLIARNLMRSRLVAVASPEYLARMGTPRRVTEIAKHACLVGFAQGEHPSTHWPLVRGGQVRVEALMASNDLGVLHTAALGGRGVALLPLPLVYDDVAAGKLAAVLPERLGGETQLAVVYPEREFVAPAVRAFVDAVVTWAKAAPELTRKMPACEEHAKKAGAKTRR
ncbi:MAG: LysR family transcriptional regulator [Myxococcaceae bacterium]|nr:MAG: LysR family transcriptional regulator [Myxococcaceae bacterium]